VAIDLFGHSAYPIGEAQRRITYIRNARPEWFETILFLSDASDLGPFGHEIALEFGIDARCKFGLFVNDKTRLDCLGEAVEFIYQVFGTDMLVATYGMDSVRPPLQRYEPMIME
jgi:hypothetical protein